MRGSDEKFLEILDRYAIPTDLKSSSVAMNRTMGGGGIEVVFYGVGQPIPLDIVTAINNEVMPLLHAEKNDGWTYEFSISDRVLSPGDPARLQASWNAHCVAADIGK